MALVLVTGEIHSVLYRQNEINNLVTSLKKNVENQVSNRVTNVKAWCQAINQGRDYNRHFVGQIGFHYSLTDLPCKDLIAKTLRSAKS